MNYKIKLKIRKRDNKLQLVNYFEITMSVNVNI